MERLHYETLREFNTPNFRVVVDYTIDPDITEYDGDFPEAMVRDKRGRYLGRLDDLIARDIIRCYMFRVRVMMGADCDDEIELSDDYLGGSWHTDPEDFQDHRECAAYTRKLRAEAGHDKIVCGSYFAGMISQAIGEARKELHRIQATRVRAA